MNQQNKYAHLTTEEKVALLEKDFLEREEGTYVRIRTTDRLGWEDTLPKDSAYSAAILQPKTVRDLYINALSIARNMILSMGHPYKVTVKVDAEKNCTDSHTVYVATKVFDDPTLELGKKLDVFIGATVHEGSHLMYTDFDDFQGERNRVIQQLLNVVEDEMIERHTGEENPGLANFLKATKYYYFGKVEDQIQTIQDKLTMAFNAILKLVRYPAALTEQETAEFADILLETREILTPYPENTKESHDAARKIYELLKDFAQNQQGEGDGEGGEGEGEGQGQGEGKENGQGNSQRQGKAKAGQQSNGGNGSGSSQEITDEEMEEILKAILKALKDNIREAEQKTITEKEMSNDLKDEDHLLAKELDGKLEIGKEAVIIKKEPNKAQYMSDLRAVKKYIPAVSKALITHGAEINSVQKGLKRGMLDGNKIAEAIQGNKNVYCRKEVVRPDRVNISILIDESGSMGGNKYVLARQAAILINEAVGNVSNVELNIYGYTDTQYNVLFAYREWGKPFDKYTLGNIAYHGGTPTTEAIKETVNRIRQKSKSKAVLLVISDGYPNGPQFRVRQAAEEAKALGIEVVGISVDSSLDRKALAEMYEQWIDMSNIQNLVKGITTIVKKIVMKTVRRSYTA